MSLFVLRTARAGLSLARPLSSAVSRAVSSRVASSSNGLTSMRLFSVSASTSYPTDAAKKTTAKTSTKKPAAKKAAGTKKVATKKKPASKKKKVAKKVAPKPKLTPEQRAERREAAALKKKKIALKEKKDALKAIPQPPKHAPGAYALFIKDNYGQHRTGQAGEKITAVTAGIANAWKALPGAERNDYFRRAELLREERALAYDEWAKNVGADAIYKLNRDRLARGKHRHPIPDSMKPPRANTPFFTFAAELRRTGQIPADLRPVSEQAKLAGELWRKLTPEQQASYKS